MRWLKRRKREKIHAGFEVMVEIIVMTVEDGEGRGCGGRNMREFTDSCSS